LEEVICHALCEVIERDAASIADLYASFIPYNILEKITDSLKKGGYPITRISAEDKFVDDPSIFPDVDISEIAEEFEPIIRLAKRFTDAGIPLLIRDITQKDIGIFTFIASSIEWVTRDYGYFAKGFGTHPNARIALICAITEASQTRAVNIHGARDDLKKYNIKKMMRYTKENGNSYLHPHHRRNKTIIIKVSLNSLKSKHTRTKIS
jgi:ribosomal protein S12 methylthiotransferase accessory factor YcaO